MPYARPTLSTILAQISSDISSGLGIDGTLRFSNLVITGKALGALTNGMYGYLDYISQQSVPYTSTDEFLEAWGALKNVYRQGAQAASGSAVFNGTASIPVGTIIVRGDSYQYQTTGAGTSTSTTVTVPIQAILPPVDPVNNPTGGGAAGNAPAGTVLTLQQAISGIQSTGSASTIITGGADIQSNESFLTEVLQAYQNPPQGGAQSDYVTWALAVPGVTRAWVNPLGFGAGSVTVYTMFDESESAYGGFPQGTNGVATAESRGTAATGDLLAVANAIYPLRPATALIFSCAPIASPQPFTISGLSTAGAAVQAAVGAAIAGVFLQYGSPLGSSVIDIEYINTAIAAIAGTAGFVITSPTANITTSVGYLPTVGTLTFD